MEATSSPTVKRRRLGSELRRLRLASGLKSTEVAERLMVSQPKIAHMENGNRAISPRDVRDLCALYGVSDQRVIDSMTEEARESGRQGWWHPYGDLCDSLYIGLETDAACLHTHAATVLSPLLQTAAYAQAVLAQSMPQLTPEQAATRLDVLLRRQRRIHDLNRTLRLWAVIDEGVLHRVVGSRNVIREQLEHLNALGTLPHITLQVLPYTAGAHPGLSGQFSILDFPDGPQEGVVYLQRCANDLYLDKPSEVQHYRTMYDRLQAKALDPDSSRDFITATTHTHAADIRA
ncbi:helix-turn-helix domain-containing protein [Streptomyces sp. NPDC102270]|uniref:helix-turn-helix domain-containing protein n=1 Tax=Streptomyces sp. NPDC102270 TaxID=3366150 RepID=UPI0038184DAC